MKKTFRVEDLDCASCAAKMEKAVCKLDGINEASINFMTQKMVLAFEDGADVDSMMKVVQKTMRKVEPDVKIK